MRNRTQWTKVFARVLIAFATLAAPAAARPAQAQTFAYVADPHTSTISVIDTASNKVVANVAGVGYPWGLAITPDGSRLYVADAGSSSVAVIDTASNIVVATVGVGDGPIGVAITPKWKPRLRRECTLQHRFRNRHCKQHRG